MALSKRVLRELHQELKQQQDVRDAAIARIDALEALLSAADPAGNRDRMARLKVPGRRGHQPSLRASVLRTLGEVASSSAADMAKRLEATGFRVGGATTLRERVAHELSRLRRKGVVRRARNGHYELAGHAIRSADESSLSEEIVTLN